MKLQIVHSTANCHDSTCPTIYKDEETGNFVIQGFIMKAADKDNIQIPKGEDAVIVPAEFLQAFIDKQKA